ncbi:MAG: UDP-N-acetylmuramoyl-L-alanine--D-glutamate ligase [Desulfohalobiaceae bacterium]|nr:UDP-N-acetylmuramoyl-L-alanine--D-glutamate ligase [Desulfohalobiaceae bacterium]
MKSLTQKKGPRLQGKRVAVVGAGRSGLASARLAQAAGAGVRLLEQSASALGPEDREQLRASGIELRIGEHVADFFSDAELVILSPGIPKQDILELLPGQEKIAVYSELEMASWFVSEPIIAVTGSNGKTTTVSLMADILESRGWHVFVGGNIGTPLSEYVRRQEPADLVVLEVSSFQLQNTSTFRPSVSVFLNFSLNHLDYHRDMQEYWQAKTMIFQNQDRGDTAILPVEWQNRRIGQLKDRVRKMYVTGETEFSCPKLPGLHNRRNMEAAALACGCYGIDKDQAAAAMRTYKGQSHRLQLVREVDGVCFVNDSKATTMEAQEAALKSFQAPILLLAGGRYKGGQPERLSGLIAERVKAVGLFGESRELFAEAWKDRTSLFWEPTLERAFQRLTALATNGDVVLLSPGTSSFDLFEDYAQRGRVFSDLARGYRAGTADSSQKPEPDR